MTTATDLLGGPLLPQSGGATSSAALSGKRILVVDDNPINLDIATETLQLAGADVDAASSGREALTLLAGKLYDLVVLDLAMPEMDGLAVGRALRASNKNADVGIVLFTASDPAEARQAAQQLGAKGLVAKPLDVDDLLRSVIKHA
jgi:two-component system, sensor histidine kinase and response regulator